MDDTIVVLSDKDPVQLQVKLNSAMNYLHAWFTANKLSLNISESNLMFFGTHAQLLTTKDIAVKLNGHKLGRV